MTNVLEAQQATAESPEDKRHILALWVGNEKVIDFTFKTPANNLFLDTAVHAVDYQYSTNPALARILSGRVDTRVPPGLGDTTKEASRNRAKIKRYNAKRPEKDYPEHTMYPRGPRNASPTRKKDAKQLNAFWDYRELNESVEPLQSNWMQAADNDNYDDAEREEGDAEQPLRRDVEAELETRPNETELIERYGVPTVHYETRQAGLITGPRLSDCGYCMAPTSPFIREMIVPVCGDVECMVTFTTTKTKGNRSVEIERQKLVKIGDLNKGDRWTLYRVGGLRFAPYRVVTPKKIYYQGAVTHYQDKHGIWRRTKEDEYGTPYGPKSMGSDDAAWVPLHPRTSKSKPDMLSPAKKAKQEANRYEPVSCPLPTDEMLEAFRRKLEANGKPANDNYDGLPYDVESADELQFGYAFGTRYPETSDPEPFDDVVERKQTLAALNARLSPQSRRVANMIVQTDETETLAQNYAQLGAVLATSRKNVSERTLMRHGQRAANDAAKEIGAPLQELAA